MADQQARDVARVLGERAESYASDARKFRDISAAGDGVLSATGAQRYASAYQVVADELRKVRTALLGGTLPGEAPGETVGTVSADGATLGSVVYHSAGPATRWEFTRGGDVIATARTAAGGYLVDGTWGDLGDLGVYPTLTVAAQDVYGQRVSVVFSTPAAVTGS